MKPDSPELKKIKNMWVALWPLLLLVFLFMFGTGQSPLTKSMGITQHLGKRVPTSLPFTTEDGKKVHLGDMLHGRPVVLVPIFYACKTGCAILTDNMIKTLAEGTKGNILEPGRDMDVVMYSIDPVEDCGLAHARKAQIFDALTPHLATADETANWRATAESGWHLLTGPKSSIKALSDAIGLKYSYKTVPDLAHKTTVNLINHPTCTVVLTPQGAISSYTIGNEFQTKEIQADVILAQRDGIGRRADQSWMFGCIMPDPMTGRNRIVVESLWRVCGVITLLALITWVISMSIKERRQNRLRGGGLSLS